MSEVSTVPEQAELDLATRLQREKAAALVLDRFLGPTVKAMRWATRILVVLGALLMLFGTLDVLLLLTFAPNVVAVFFILLTLAAVTSMLWYGTRIRHVLKRQGEIQSALTGLALLDTASMATATNALKTLRRGMPFMRVRTLRNLIELAGEHPVVAEGLVLRRKLASPLSTVAIYSCAVSSASMLAFLPLVVGALAI